MKRVCYIVMAFPVPSEAFASVELRELKRQGVNVCVKTLRQRRTDYDKVSHQQDTTCIEVEYAGPKTRIPGLLRAVFHPVLLVRLWRMMIADLWRRPTVLLACLWWSIRCFDLLERVRKEKPNVVHLYWGHATAMLGWMILETFPSQKLTTSLSAYDIELGLPISFDVASRCEGVRTWSPSGRKTMTDRGVPASQIKLIHQGIDVSLFRGTANSRAKKMRGRIAVAARLIPEKGIAQTIKIVASVRERYPEAHLFVYGDGPERSMLMDQVRRMGEETLVTFAGHVDQRTLAVGLQQAQFFLLPSTHHAERLPNVLKEAIAAGCYCITTPTPDVECLIADDSIGAIVPAGETQAWVGTIIAQLARRDHESESSIQTRQRVLETFDLETTTRELLSWWNLVEDIPTSETHRSSSGKLVTA